MTAEARVANVLERLIAWVRSRLPRRDKADEDALIDMWGP
jgi:hypothetical protein